MNKRAAQQKGGRKKEKQGGQWRRDKPTAEREEGNLTSSGGLGESTKGVSNIARFRTRAVNSRREKKGDMRNTGKIRTVRLEGRGRSAEES